MAVAESEVLIYYLFNNIVLTIEKKILGIFWRVGQFLAGPCHHFRLAVAHLNRKPIPLHLNHPRHNIHKVKCAQNWTNHRTTGLISEDRSNKGYSASYNTRFPFKSSASDRSEVRSKSSGLASPYCSTLACIHACPQPPRSRI